MLEEELRSYFLGQLVMEIRRTNSLSCIDIGSPGELGKIADQIVPFLKHKQSAAIVARAIGEKVSASEEDCGGYAEYGDHHAYPLMVIKSIDFSKTAWVISHYVWLLKDIGP